MHVVVFASKKMVIELCLSVFFVCSIIIVLFLSVGMSKFSGKDQIRYVCYIVSITKILVKNYNTCP